jgi:selenocysteine-specific elongation factor
MIGTAGHVDHGKTSLVRCLTGFDTDRRPEERARGLSIDFDVAPFPLPDGRVAGIIDVPGHEDFVRNMVAGASSIDVLMLIVAADDAVMPQTVEHLKIARLMGMSALLTVITKIDLVDKEQLLLVEDDVRGFLAENGYADSPIYFASITTGAGIEEIRQGVAALAAGIERKQSDKAFRMFVRVSFSMKGHGTVVTGVPCSGSIKAGDPLELLPSGEKLTLRSVQTYREEVEEAVSHRSSALNIREAPVSMFARGMTLCEPGVFRPTRSLLVHFDNLEDKPLKHRGEYRFHVGTAAIVCRIKTLHGEALSPRASGFLHLVLKEPCAVCAGDRFVLRSLSPASTLGGGLVLGANPGRVRR